MTELEKKGKKQEKVTENKRMIFREFAREIGCRIIIEKGLPQCLDKELKHVGSGVYVQLRRRGEFYIGESIDVLERQKEHLANGVKLSGLAVLQVNITDRNRRKQLETAVIAAAQRKGLWLANISKLRLAEELNKQEREKAIGDAIKRIEMNDAKAVFEFGLGGWLVTLDKAKARATPRDWEKYLNFKASVLHYPALVALSMFVRRVIAFPEKTYGKTWCIGMNATGCPGPEWLWVKTQQGKVFEVRVVQTEDDSVLRTVFWIERTKLDVLVERCEGKNAAIRTRLGIASGRFDFVRSYVDGKDDTAVLTSIYWQRKPEQVALELDLEQGLEFMQSRTGAALMAECPEVMTEKEVGEGFRLGRLLF